MSDKVVNTYPSPIKVFHECFMTKEIRDKAINRCFSVSDSIPNQYKAEEACDRVVFWRSFLLVYCPDK